MKTYKIVHRQFGSTGYLIENKEEAIELMNLIAATNKESLNQYYIKEI